MKIKKILMKFKKMNLEKLGLYLIKEDFDILIYIKRIVKMSTIYKKLKILLRLLIKKFFKDVLNDINYLFQIN